MFRHKIIWHLGGGIEFWNYVLLASIKQNLQEIADFTLEFVHIDYQNTHFVNEMIDVMNKEADLLLVGGGGAIFNRPEDQSLSGWQFSIEKENLKNIEVPVVIYGIGYNKFHFDSSGFKEGINEHLIETQNIAKIFSVRNNGTKRELINRGLDANKIEVVPDAGSFLRKNKIDIPGVHNDKLKIGINWVSDRPFYTFPEPFEKNKRILIKEMCKVFKFLIKEKNVQIIQIEHIKNLDDDITLYMKEELGDDFISIQERIPFMYPPNEISATFLMDIYSQMDLVIGMRGHANIIPFGVGTPFIALSSHNKNRFFLEEIDESNYLIDIRKMDEKTIANNILEKIEELIIDCNEYKKRNKIKYVINIKFLMI